MSLNLLTGDGATCKYNKVFATFSSHVVLEASTRHQSIITMAKCP